MQIRLYTQYYPMLVSYSINKSHFGACWVRTTNRKLEENNVLNKTKWSSKIWYANTLDKVPLRWWVILECQITYVLMFGPAKQHLAALCCGCWGTWPWFILFPLRVPDRYVRGAALYKNIYTSFFFCYIFFSIWKSSIFSCCKQFYYPSCSLEKPQFGFHWY